METLPALQETQIEALIAQAIDKSVPVETMKELLAMRRELKAEYAKEAFDKALSEFQKECPIIEKTKHVKNSNGIIVYSYAPIESIVAQVKEFLQKYGFSYMMKTDTFESSVTASCIVKHKDGYSEVSSFTVPLGTKTALMSATQQVAAAITFASRYAFRNAFGILTGDEDTDGALVKGDKEEKRTIYKVTEDQICKVCKLEKLEDISLQQAIAVIRKLLKSM